MVNDCKVRVDLLINEGLTDGEIAVIAAIRNTQFGRVIINMADSQVVRLTTEVCIDLSKINLKGIDKHTKR